MGAERIPGQRSLLDIFGGIREQGLGVSRRAERTIMTASKAGVPLSVIDTHVSNALSSARREGRTKIGPFGGARTVFDSLRQATQARVRYSLQGNS